MKTSKNKRGRPSIDAMFRSWVRFVYRNRLATQAEIAKFLGYSQSTISRIVSE